MRMNIRKKEVNELPEQDTLDHDMILPHTSVGSWYHFTTYLGLFIAKVFLMSSALLGALGYITLLCWFFGIDSRIDGVRLIICDIEEVFTTFVE